MRAVFAENLAHARADLGVSQRQAAAALGVSQALLSHYEKGIREPGLDFVVRAAQYYGISTDRLLGCDTAEHMEFQNAVPCPSSFGRTIERELRDTLDVVMDLLNRNYDPDIYCYASLYLSEALYEVARYFSRMDPGYEPTGFGLSDERFNSGAVNSDMSWVRARYIMAISRHLEQKGPLPPADLEDMRANYGGAMGSLRTLLSRVGERVNSQSSTDVRSAQHLFDDVEPEQTPDQKEEHHP